MGNIVFPLFRESLRDFLSAVRIQFLHSIYNQAKKGKDFRLRFLWRLFLLFIIGCFNGAFFPGDILVLYSIIGVVLVLVCKWSDRAVLIAAIILMLQPLELGKFFYAMMNPDYVPAAAFGVCIATYVSVPFAAGFLGDGQVQPLGRPVVQSVVGMGYGRFFQTASLFLLGMLIGRRQLFAKLSEHRVFWMRTLVIGAVCFVPLYFITASLPDMISNKAMLTPMNTVVSSFRNFFFHVCVGRLFRLPVATSFDP